MALSQRLISFHFPFVPFEITIRSHTREFEALLDTGFDGDVVLPAGLFTDADAPDGYLTCQLADGTERLMPLYRGVIRVGDLATFPIVALALGDEPLVGRGISDHFRVVLDHGRELIVEP
jgi:predicted aspartyl protease